MPSAAPWRSGGYQRFTNGTPTANDAPAKPSRNPSATIAANESCTAIRLPGGELVAYSSICTHLACAILWRAEDGHLECPCHEGVFDPATGEVLAGPPPRPLPRVRVREDARGIWAVGTA